MTGRLVDKVAIVTGASRGIGHAIATAFAREGAKVVIASRKEGPLQAAADAINEVYPGSTLACATHTGDIAQITALLDFASEHFGTPNVVVNNAATNPYFGPMVHTDPGAWSKTIEVNLTGYFELARGAANRLVAEGVPGSIINVSSVAGLMAAPFQGVYGVTKAGVISMTRTLAVELGASGIRVNAIAPGLVDTKLAAAMTQNDQISKMYTDRAALKRYAQPEELAGPAVFLASDEASYVTGTTLTVDGGYVMA